LRDNPNEVLRQNPKGEREKVYDEPRYRHDEKRRA